MASLDDIPGGEDSDSSETDSRPEKPAVAREGAETHMGNATAPAAAAPAALVPPAVRPIEAARATRKPRTRAGKTGDSKSATGESSDEGAGEGGDEEPFRLPAHIYRSIVDEATRDAAEKAKRLVLEDVGFSAHVTSRVLDKLNADKASEVERTPTQAAAIEVVVAPVEDVTDAEVTEVADDTSATQKKTSTTEETPKKKVDDESHGFLIAIVVVIVIVVLWFAFKPSAPNDTSDEEQTTSDSSDTETDDTVSASAARPIAPASANPTPEAIAAFAARVPYSLSERLTALRELRGTGINDMRDMDCGNSGINFSTRAFITRTTASGPDTRLLTQAEAQTYFADATHTGQHTIDAVEGQRHYTVYLDLRDREGQTGHCNFFTDN